MKEAPHIYSNWFGTCCYFNLSSNLKRWVKIKHLHYPNSLKVGKVLEQNVFHSEIK